MSGTGKAGAGERLGRSYTLPLEVCKQRPGDGCMQTTSCRAEAGGLNTRQGLGGAAGAEGIAGWRDCRAVGTLAFDLSLMGNLKPQIGLGKRPCFFFTVD